MFDKTLWSFTLNLHNKKYTINSIDKIAKNDENGKSASMFLQ